MRRVEEPYYPAPESAGGWRRPETPAAVRDVAGMDPHRLSLAAEAHALQAGTTASVAIVRHGWLVAEWHEVSALATTRFDVWSCTKSFTGTAYGVLFGDRRDVDLDTAVYDFLPEGQPLRSGTVPSHLWGSDPTLLSAKQHLRGGQRLLRWHLSGVRAGDPALLSAERYLHGGHLLSPGPEWSHLCRVRRAESTLLSTERHLCRGHGLRRGDQHLPGVRAGRPAVLCR